MSVRLLATGVAFAGILALPAAAQPATATSRIPTVTRLVKIFSDLETRLAASVAARDVATIEQTLDADFEMRIGSMPGTPIPRADWIRQSIGTPGEPSIDQMAVHDFGTVAVVSYRRAGNAAAGASAGGSLFVVDCWKRVGDGWKLATRYVSNATAPTAVTPPATIDKRY
jgi:isoaspartyl peptidase/L-asparaginase-like protein (Ntn-hydrolase superfamily)